MKKRKAIVAIARKLLLWGTAKGVARRLNGSRWLFVRRQLTQLGLGTELTKVGYGKEAIALPLGGSPC